MENILILSAFPEEQMYYKSKLQVIETKKFDFVEVTICQYKNILVYLATTGIGTINAALVLATITAKVPFDAVFFSGTSGGIDPRLKKGDVVVADDAFDADIFSIHDAVKGTPFEPALINSNKKDQTPRFFKASSELLGHAKIKGWVFKVLKGRIATSNHFPSPAALYEDIKGKHPLAIDMESAAIYQFSWLTGLPCLVVRSVSNTLDTNGADDEVENSEVSSSDHAAMLVLDCINGLLKTPALGNTNISSSTLTSSKL